MSRNLLAGGLSARRFSVASSMIIFALIAVLAAIPCRASDPPNFSNADIGADYGYGFTAGSDTYSSGVLYATGSGGGAGFNPGSGYYDQYHFSYATVPSGTNFRLIAEILGVTPTSGVVPEVGLAVRAGTADVDEEGYVIYAPLAGYNDQNTVDSFLNGVLDTPSTDPVGWNEQSGGWIQSGEVGPAIALPFWIQLVRTGNTYATYKSADGVNWSMITNVSGGAYVASGSVDVGFVICGGFNGTTDDPSATATISNISLNESPVLPYESSWIGDTVTGDATGWVPSNVDAMWVDSSGDCFVNATGMENSGFPDEYTNGAVNKLFNQYWWQTESGGYGEEGSITGDNAGNIYFWGVQYSTFGILEAAISGTTAPIMLNTSMNTTSSAGTSMATGMVWDPYTNPPLLYVSDPPANKILAVNPAQQGSSQEVTAQDFAFAGSNPGPMTIDSSGRLWIISEGNTPGSDGVEQIGAPSTIHPAAVYCYTPTSTGATLDSLKISGVNDTTEVYQSQPITAASDASPIVITTYFQNGLATGDSVTISGVEGNTAANGTWTVTVTSPTMFSLNGSAGNGTYTFGGNVSMPSGLTVGWNPTAIWYDGLDSHNRLLITDNGPDQDVKIWNLASWTSGTKSTPTSSYGAVGGVYAGATPGLIASSSDYNRFCGPVGVGTDSSGNIYVAENYNQSGGNPMADIRSLTSAGVQNWDLAGLTWVNCGDFDPQTGDEYTIHQHYRMNYANGAGGEWSEYSFLWNPFEYGVIPDNGNLDQTNITRRINGSLFLFVTGQGGAYEMNIYRMNGEQIVPCGSIFTDPDGNTDVWSDTNADGIQETTDQITSAAIPYGAFDVDSNGNIWLANGGNSTYPATITELLLQSVTGGVPMYSVASSPADYVTYTLPAPFTNVNWSDPRLRYIASTNTMYIMGDTYVFPTTGSEQATVLRINNFTTSPTIAWTFETPMPDITPLAFLVYYGDFQYESFDVENDKVFVAEMWGPVHVYDANTGEPITVLNEGPEVSGGCAWDDCYIGMHAYYDPADNEYAVSEENSGNSGRQNLYRWSPFSGSPSAKSFKVTGATDASPIVITTSTAHGLVTGQTVVIDGVLGNTAANGTWKVTKVSSTQVDLTTNYITGATSSGNGTFTSGSGTLEYGGVPGDQDIDSPTKAGSASQTAGTYTVNGGGAGYGLSGGVDQFNLCWTQMDGNGSIAAQVTGLSGSTNANASAGVMIRNAIGTAGTDPEVSLVVTLSNGLKFQYRSAASGATTTAATLSGISPSSDEFVMLVRSTTNSAGDTFSAYYSANGVSWTQLGSSVVFSTPMNLTTYAGLAVTAALNSSLATATFDRELLGNTQISVPAAPTGVSASSYTNGVIVSWNYDASSNYEENALTYNVYRGTTSGGETLLASGVGSTSWTDTSAVNGDTYYYEVTGVGTGGESAKSTEASVCFQNWNPSFEWPVVWNSSGTYAWAPPSDAWTFTPADDWPNLAGVGESAAAGAWTSIPAPNGTQFAIIFDDGEISQTLTGFQSSTTYTVTFYAAQAQSPPSSYPNAMEVTMDGAAVSLTQVGGGSVSNPVEPGSTAFTEYSFQFVTGSDDPGSHTLAFTGTNPDGGDQDVVLFDDIMFTPGL